MFELNWWLIVMCFGFVLSGISAWIMWKNRRSTQELPLLLLAAGLLIFSGLYGQLKAQKGKERSLSIARWVEFKAEMHCHPNGIIGNSIQFKCDGDVLVVFDGNNVPSMDLLDRISPSSVNKRTSAGN